MEENTVWKDRIRNFGGSSLRVILFLCALIAAWFIIILVDRALIPYVLHHKAPETMSFPALVTFILVLKTLFRKIVRQLLVKDHLIAIILYLICNAFSIALIVAGEPDLAPALSWTGLIGICAYFLLIKPFKKNMLEEEAAQ